VIGLVAIALAGAVVAPTGASAAADTATLQCVTVLEGGDIGDKFCFSEPDCLVAHYHTTFLGTTRTCLVPRP
jgi:hypothetical protein